MRGIVWKGNKEMEINGVYILIFWNWKTLFNNQIGLQIHCIEKWVGGRRHYFDMMHVQKEEMLIVQYNKLLPTQSKIILLFTGANKSRRWQNLLIPQLLDEDYK